jgi:hypothetical protein
MLGKDGKRAARSDGRENRGGHKHDGVHGTSRRSAATSTAQAAESDDDDDDDDDDKGRSAVGSSKRKRARVGVESDLLGQHGSSEPDLEPNDGRTYGQASTSKARKIGGSYLDEVLSQRKNKKKRQKQAQQSNASAK